MSSKTDKPVASRPPRDGLVRAVDVGGVEVRDASGSDQPTLLGHFAVFDDWTEINSIFEGQFMERFAPGAFTKTFAEQRDQMRVLFQHGRDPQIGDKPLGPIETLREDKTGKTTGVKGAYYEVPMFDTAYNAEILPALRAGQFGASFRFRVIAEDFNNKPGRSTYNPEGLPERTVREAQVSEFGPVTFPAYQSATAGVRSLTDFDMVERFAMSPQAEPLLRAMRDYQSDGRVEDKAPEAKPDEEPDTRSRPIEFHAAADVGEATDAIGGICSGVELIESVLDTVGCPVHDDPEVDVNGNPAETHSLDEYNSAIENVLSVIEVIEDLLAVAGFPDPDEAADALGRAQERLSELRREHGVDSEEPDKQDADATDGNTPAPPDAAAETHDVSPAAPPLYSGLGRKEEMPSWRL